MINGAWGKSRIAPINCASGTVPGEQVSSKNENLIIPSRIGSVGIRRLSFNITTFDSRGPSPKSMELR